MKLLHWVIAMLATIAIIGVALFAFNSTFAPVSTETKGTLMADITSRISSELSSCSHIALDNSNEIAEEPRPAAIKEPVYPSAWTVVSVDGIDAFELVQVRTLPGFDIVPHREEANIDVVSVSDESQAVIVCNGTEHRVNPDLLLVNLPDLLSASTYDVVYSYSSTSRCAGIDIPGLTGEKLEGYAPGKQYNAYLGKDEFAVPASYHTALMLSRVEEKLMKDGYAFCFYDVYRPYRASVQISHAFADAYHSSSDIQRGTGGWGLTWYAADGVSGHNFGTDVDTGVCDAATGRPIAMPSHFDAFDEGGHLSTSQLNWQNVNEGNYRSEVLENDACMALHRAMTAEGFRELASEWWHFADAEGESIMTSIVGYQGLDFQASTLA